MVMAVQKVVAWLRWVDAFVPLSVCLSVVGTVLAAYGVGHAIVALLCAHSYWLPIAAGLLCLLVAAVAHREGLLRFLPARARFILLQQSPLDVLMDAGELTNTLRRWGRVLLLCQERPVDEVQAIVRGLEPAFLQSVFWQSSVHLLPSGLRQLLLPDDVRAVAGMNPQALSSICSIPSNASCASSGKKQQQLTPAKIRALVGMKSKEKRRRRHCAHPGDACGTALSNGGTDRVAHVPRLTPVFWFLRSRASFLDASEVLHGGGSSLQRVQLAAAAAVGACGLAAVVAVRNRTFLRYISSLSSSVAPVQSSRTSAAAILCGLGVVGLGASRLLSWIARRWPLTLAALLPPRPTRVSDGGQVTRASALPLRRFASDHSASSLGSTSSSSSSPRRPRGMSGCSTSEPEVEEPPSPRQDAENLPRTPKWLRGVAGPPRESRQAFSRGNRPDTISAP